MKISTRDDAAMLRDVLTPIWATYYRENGATDTIPSTNMCCLTASMVAEVDPDWSVVHGEVDGEPHAWCQRADGTVLDLTGDQFGRPEVIWGALPEGYEVGDEDDQTPCGEHHAVNVVGPPMLGQYERATSDVLGVSAVPAPEGDDHQEEK